MVIIKNGSNNLNNYENYGLSIINSFRSFSGESIRVNNIKVLDIGRNSIGGLYLEDNEAIEIKEGLFIKNRAFYGGAIHVFSNSAVLIDNCTFLMNNGNEIGGAVFFNNTFNFEIMNSKFVENSSPLGSAVSFLFSLKDFQNQLLMIKIHHNEFLLSFPNQNQNDSRFDLFYINFGPYHQYFCQNNSFNENVNEIVDFNLTCASLTFLENSSFSLKITHLAGLSLNTVIVYLSILDLQITPIIFNNSFLINTPPQYQRSFITTQMRLFYQPSNRLSTSLSKAFMFLILLLL